MIRKIGFAHVLAAVTLLLLGLTSIGRADDKPGARTLFDFTSEDASDRWRSVNDGVMGGVSEGSFRLSDEQTLLFSGTLSLENNGGFASIRSVPEPLPISSDDVLVVRARGDGRSYLLNLYVPTRRTAYSFRAPMPTTRGEWTETRVPIREFVAQSYGEPVEGAGPVDAEQVNAIGITLSDGEPGAFELEVSSIGLEPAEARADR